MSQVLVSIRFNDICHGDFSFNFHVFLQLKTHILFNVDPSIFWELQPSLLVLHTNSAVFGVKGILQLDACLHSCHRTVPTMF